MPDLLNFDIAVEPVGDGYRARVLSSPAGEATTDFVLPFTEEALTILILRVLGSIGRIRRRVRLIQSEERGLVEDFGEQLFKAVFSGAVRDCLGRSRAVADSRDTGLRIRLRLPGTLAHIPWEYLHERGYGFLGLSPETALVRYVEMPAPVRPFPIRPPLRILAMIPEPTDVTGLSGEEEWTKLTDALGDLIHDGLVEVDRLEAGTLAALQRPLRLREYHVLHFIGHGRYDEEAEDGALALEGTGGRTRLVTGRDLGLMIRGHKSLRLVVLNACEGARSASDDPFSGVAQALVHQGIPGVIAMQFEITDPAALTFSQSFYQAIADGLPVDLATLEARRTMFAEGNELEWATPVLYLRSPNGQIFQPTADPGGPAQEEAGRHARREADRKAEADRRAGEEAARQAQEEADRKERQNAERRAQEEAERRVQEEADQQAREEAVRQSQLITSLQALLRDQFSGRRFETVLGIADRLADLDPAAADPDGLTTLARQELARAAAPAVPAEAAQTTPPAEEPAQSQSSTAPAASPPPAPREIFRLARTLTGHKGLRDKSVTGAAFSPDGQLIATSSWDKTVRLWDPTTGKLRHTLHHGDWALAVAFSPDGQLLASSDAGPRLNLWYPGTGEYRRTLSAARNRVEAITFSPDGRLLATGSSSMTVQLWDPATGELQHTLTEHGNRVDAVAFSPDGQLLASGSRDKTIRLWDPTTGELQHTLTEHADRVDAVAFSPDGQLLASGGRDGVRIWDLATGQPRQISAKLTSGVAFSPDGQLLASCGVGLHLWDVASGQLHQTLTGYNGYLNAVAFSPDGQLLTSCGHQKKVWLWALRPPG